METLPILRKVKIKHPSADIISIVEGEGAYSGLNTSEVAFFLKGSWVVTPIEPFAEYHDGSPMDADTAVYPYVPNALIEAFILENGV
jgi:gentisate 1,2-dioxygenase